jgi:hypothetical protein
MTIQDDGGTSGTNCTTHSEEAPHQSQTGRQKDGDSTGSNVQTATLPTMSASDLQVFYDSLVAEDSSADKLLQPSFLLSHLEQMMQKNSEKGSAGPSPSSSSPRPQCARDVWRRLLAQEDLPTRKDLPRPKGLRAERRIWRHHARPWNPCRRNYHPRTTAHELDLHSTTRTRNKVVGTKHDHHGGGSQDE